MPLTNYGCDAFSHIELLVVLSIIAILAGMMMPALGAERAAVHTSLGSDSLRQIVLKATSDSVDRDGIFPSGAFSAEGIMWTEGDLLDGDYCASKIVWGQIASPSRRRGVLHCPNDYWQSIRLSFVSMSYGVNRRLAAYVLLFAAPMDWAANVKVSGIRETGVLAMVTDVRDLRWQVYQNGGFLPWSPIDHLSRFRWSNAMGGALLSVSYHV